MFLLKFLNAIHQNYQTIVKIENQQIYSFIKLIMVHFQITVMLKSIILQLQSLHLTDQLLNRQIDLNLFILEIKLNLMFLIRNLIILILYV